MHTGFPWTQVIRDGKGAAPGRWCYRTVQGAEERQSVRVGDRQNWNFRWCRSRIFHVEAFRARSGANTGSQRVTGVKRQVGNRPSLRTCFVSPCALRVYVACKIAVVARIRIDDATNSAMLCSDLGLDPAKRISVAHDDDLTAHIDATACELLVVLLITIVGVYEFTGHIAIYGISVIDRHCSDFCPEVVSSWSAGSSSFAINFCGEVISRIRVFGVGKSTSNLSIAVSKPQERKRLAMNSAFSLSYAEPRWCGRAESRFIQSRRSSFLMTESNCFPRALARLAPAGSKPGSGNCWPAGPVCAYRAVIQRPRIIANCGSRIRMPHCTAGLGKSAHRKIVERGLRE